MESFKIENLSFTYPERYDKALDNINLKVNQGEFLLICGKSGCGKTTLLRLLKSSLAPFGEMNGCIYFNGGDLSDYDGIEQASQIGFVMQNPDNQIVTDKVWHELAFGLESLGFKTPDIRTRVSEMASFFGIDNWFYKKVTELSGGQKQLLNLASVMVMQPSVLILDEPTSQLDPIASGEFLNTLKKINRELGVTVILTEHRLEDAFSLADRVVVMDNGKIVADETPKEIGKILKDINHDMYMALPTPVRVHGEVKNSLPCPLTVRDGRLWLDEYAKDNDINPDAIFEDAKKEIAKDFVIETKDVWFRYEKDLPDVVKGLNLSVKKGELFCIVGGNGVGKTTALSLVSGLNFPYRGKVYIKGQEYSHISNPYDRLVGVLPQNPESLFVKKTVYLDLQEAISDKKISKEEKEEMIENISSLCNIERLLDYHPYDLSGGEKQRAALAKVLLKEPEILLLDEPTKGMDAQFKIEFAHILSDLKENGVTILMVSHDIEFCAEFADRCALFFDGNITSEGSPREFFAGKSFYTTSANRMARSIIPKAVLAEDIIISCGGTVRKKERQSKKIKFHKVERESKPQKEKDKKLTPASDRKLARRTVVESFLILLLIPLTIYFGMVFLGDRKYFFISLVIIIETMIPFCLVFEARKPKARELIVISVLCAIAVAGRAAFFMIPQFKPVVALVIIAGVCFGGETGFLVGAIAGFVSNFFFGQGPWTPWQMFAFGIIGFIAGILFKKGFLRRTKMSLCIFGFISTLVIYGGLMNLSSVVTVSGKINLDMVISIYMLGLPLDLIHAFSSAFFLWFISEPMIDKFERIKVKYGLIER